MLNRVKKTAHRAYKWVCRTGGELNRCRVPTYAATCAFYMFFSLVPLIVLLCSLVRFTPFTQEAVLDFFSGVIPVTARGFVFGIIEEVYSSSVGVLSVSALATLWSASRAFGAVTRGLNEIYTDGRGRSFIMQQIYSVLYTLFLLLSVILSLSLMVFGDSIAGLVGIPDGWYNTVSLVRFGVLFLFLTLTFTGLYTWAPNMRLRIRDQLPGAMVSALSWLLFSYLFSLYVTTRNGLSAYGSIAGIIIVMLWLYYCMYIILIGGYINRSVQLKKNPAITGKGEKMDKTEILAIVDHTLLKQTATWNQIKETVDDGIKYSAASVCIPSCYVKQAAEYAKGQIAICTVIGFPNGNSTTAAKVFETRDAIENGCDEIDMVINIGWLKDEKYEDILSEINAVKKACDGRLLKVIIETCLLTDEEKIKMCEIISKSDAQFIKTSTGFSTGGATVADIELFARHCAPHIKIKAAGGISDFADAKKMIEAGASRLGTSRLIGICKKEQ